TQRLPPLVASDTPAAGDIRYRWDAGQARQQGSDGSKEHSKQFMSLEDFIHRHRRLAVLTGAGCSTESGIPDYRDLEGLWKRSPPMTYQVFVGSELSRQRYWARSMLGWPLIAAALPNPAHLALAALEERNRT